MSYYSQYLFQSPLYEDTYYDYNVYDYLNENFYPAEINEMYKDFLIENFGIQIIDEDYYDYIVSRYGEENLLREMVYSLNEYNRIGSGKWGNDTESGPIGAVTPHTNWKGRIKSDPNTSPKSIVAGSIKPFSSFESIRQRIKKPPITGYRGDKEGNISFRYGRN